MFSGNKPRAILLTRPEPQNSEFARDLRALNNPKIEEFADIIEMPLARYVSLNPDIPALTEFDVGIVTSRAVFDFFNLDVRLIDWIVVGNQSYEFLREAGARVLQKFDNASELAHQLTRFDGGRLVYFRAEEVSLDLKKMINPIQEHIIYRLVPEKITSEQMTNLRLYEEIYVPVFSNKSFLRSAEFIESLAKDVKIKLLPISALLADMIRKNTEKSSQNIELAIPPKKPDRTHFIVSIQEFLADRTQ